MNFIDPILPQSREARLKYLDGDYQVLKEGEFVRCAVTGDPIRLEDLRYWSVERQEAYRSAEISFRRTLERPGSSDQK
ncbi:MAG: DUF2093 domain-containing protein [Rhizobiales bacterium]|nr:DUF2093 domain-containing protein [Hyphomicrobiales bacterium]